MKIVKGFQTIAVNNNTVYTNAVEIGQRLSYFEPLIQRLSGSGTVDVTVQGILKAPSVTDNDWADLVDVTGINSAKLYTAGARLAAYDFVRLKVTSTGSATMKMTIVGVHV